MRDAIQRSCATLKGTVPWPMPASSLWPVRDARPRVFWSCSARRGEIRARDPQGAAPPATSCARAAAADRFTGKSGSALDIVAPAGLQVGAADRDRGRQGRQAQAAGFRQARRHRHGQGSGARPSEATIFAGTRRRRAEARPGGRVALGTQLRAYVFDRYKTKRKEGEERAGQAAGHASRSPTSAAAQKAWSGARAGRRRRRSWRATSINEPANVLYPEEFARRAAR